MKKFLHVLMMCIISSVLYAGEYESPMSLYKDNYFIAGNVKDQVKVQLSAKYNVLYPSETGLFFGYTQLSNWFVYQGRDKFYTMYNPEFIYRFESGKNIFNDYAIPYIDYFQVSPIAHSSTGVEDEDHRSINTYYGQIQLSAGDVLNVGFNVQYFRYYTISADNPDINKYKKNYTADIFIKIRSKSVEYLDKEELHIKLGGNPRGYGFYCIEAKFRIITSKFQPKIFCQFFNGYDEFMVFYNKKETSIRGGFVF
jgi:outer membrane phospholipase A